jgi:hypothetical protein
VFHSSVTERNHTTHASDQKEKPFACGIYDPAVFFLVFYCGFIGKLFESD